MFTMIKKILILLLIVLACCAERESTPTPQQDTIVGHWQLVADWFPSGIIDNDYPIKWSPVREGYRWMLTFSANGDYLSTHVFSPTPTNKRVDKGVYTLRDTIESGHRFKLAEVSYTYLLARDSVWEKGRVRFSYSFEQGDLILSPFPCGDEGCAYRFRKQEDVKVKE